MASFVVNQDISTTTPTIEVTINADQTLPLGVHRFQLVVVDDSNNKSSAAVVEITVIDTSVPTANVFATNSDGAQITSVPFGQTFQLNGSKSFDTGGGKIVNYVWTYLGPKT